MTHTRDEIMAMTAEELRVAIAKKKGIENINCDREGDWFGISVRGNHATAFFRDWITDIAAAYQLEESVPVNQHALYEQYLYVAIGKGIEWTFWDLIHATAEQKSRAWLIWSEESGK